MAEMKIVRKPEKLSQAAYESLCSILEATPRLPFVKGQGKQYRQPNSHGTLARRYGVSRPTVSKIAASIRAGTHKRARGVQAREVGPHGTFGKGVSVPASEGQPAIRAHLDRPAMLEFLLNGGWQSTV